MSLRRRRLLAAIAALVSAACMIPGIVRAVALRAPSADERYGVARAALERLSVREAGYLSDADLSLGRGPDVWRFHEAAYALAPVLLLPETRERYLLVDVPDAAMVANLLRAPDLRLVQDCGAGVAVVEKR